MFTVVHIIPLCCFTSERRPLLFDPKPCTLEENTFQMSFGCVWVRQRRSASDGGLQRRTANGDGLRGPRGASAPRGVRDNGRGGAERP